VYNFNKMVEIVHAIAILENVELQEGAQNFRRHLIKRVLLHYLLY